jgi:hypothetical protein
MQPMANPNGNPQNLVFFKPGQSGNPGGKPVHARNRVTGAFLTALADDFEEHGRAAIVACREQNPARYLTVVASLLPRQWSIDDARDKEPDEMTTEELVVEIAAAKERALAQEQFARDWYAAQALSVDDAGGDVKAADTASRAEDDGR